MVEINTNRAFCENIKNSLEEQIIDYVKDFIKFTQPDEMIRNVSNWYESCGSKLWYKKSNGKYSYLETIILRVLEIVKSIMLQYLLVMVHMLLL